MTDTTTPATTTETAPANPGYGAVLTEKFGDKYSFAFDNHMLWACTSTMMGVMAKLKNELGFNML